MAFFVPFFRPFPGFLLSFFPLGTFRGFRPSLSFIVAATSKVWAHHLQLIRAGTGDLSRKLAGGGGGEVYYCSGPNQEQAGTVPTCNAGTLWSWDVGFHMFASAVAPLSQQGETSCNQTRKGTGKKIRDRGILTSPKSSDARTSHNLVLPSDSLCLAPTSIGHGCIINGMKPSNPSLQAHNHSVSQVKHGSPFLSILSKAATRRFQAPFNISVTSSVLLPTISGQVVLQDSKVPESTTTQDEARRGKTRLIKSGPYGQLGGVGWCGPHRRAPGR
ncbi:hypothetical protein B0H17DRAFT_1148762 [Mycena rosella]|uniref:Uncharacterized protein n=1 Tax=Mycena rosella TaxID=1033263 RepID=A0AAD7CBH8_MYCRO|nr:hypothetical protein B0H17DRAFT_1148762 [Mycena rosella]